MKKVLCLVVFFGVLSIVAAQKVEFKNIENNVIDYGNVKLNAEAVATVQVKNVGDKPLTIEVQKTCGCTVVEQPKAPIMPGKVGSFKVKYNNTNREHTINKTVNVKSNDKDTPVIPLKMKGVVVK